MFLPFSFSLSSLVHYPRFYLSFLFLQLSLIVCSFNFWTMGHNLSFNLSLMFVPLVSHHWDRILLLYLFVFPSLGSHHRFDLSLCFVSFGSLSLGQHTRFYLSSIIGSFGFSLSFGHDHVFNQTFIFVPLISHPSGTILHSIYHTPIFFSSFDYYYLFFN